MSRGVAESLPTPGVGSKLQGIRPGIKAPSGRHKRRAIMRKVALSLAIVGLALPLLAAAPAQAQATRTWVSGTGDDLSPTCSRTAPCKTFQGAYNKTAAGGEINCLDSGGFGTLTITMAVTVSCEAGTAGILGTGGGN